MNIHTSLEDRIQLLLKLNQFLGANSPELIEVKEKAQRMNGWFTQEFIDQAIKQISNFYLEETKLREFAKDLITAESKNKQLKIGITMAGNIPLVGFHDFLCAFLSGHTQIIKFSSKDDVLLPYLISLLYSWNEHARELVYAADMLKGCDAYIATGSNNSARYFEQYFAKYPNIIRRNRTSVALLDGTETPEELTNLADDIQTYFGLGCRNVTKIMVPSDYNFEPLIQALKKYEYFKDHNKFRNNYDYNLALYILNNQFYMSSEGLLLAEHPSIFSPISVLHYEFYSNEEEACNQLKKQQDIQAIIGHKFLPFGSAQSPSLKDFADGINTIDFLNSL